MREDLQTALDFHYETDKDNPFHLHRTGNAGSQSLVHIRNQAFILNKLALLPTLITTPVEEECMQLYAHCIEGIANNEAMPYRNFEAVSDLVTHIEIYYRRLLLNSGGSGVALFWPRVRAALMTIEDRIPKTGCQWIREYVAVRRGLLEPDKKYFVSQFLAKKIDTSELRNLLSFFRDEVPISSPLRPDTPSTPQHRIRMIPLSDEDTDWQYLEQLRKQPLTPELTEYITDMLQSYLQQKKHQMQGEIKLRSNSLRGRVIRAYLGA